MKTKSEILKEYSPIKIITEKEYNDAKEKITPYEFKLHYSKQSIKKLTEMDNFNILPYCIEEDEYYYIDTISEDELKLNLLYDTLNEIKNLSENILIIKYSSIFLSIIGSLYFFILWYTLLFE